MLFFDAAFMFACLPAHTWPEMDRLTVVVQPMYARKYIFENRVVHCACMSAVLGQEAEGTITVLIHVSWFTRALCTSVSIGRRAWPLSRCDVGIGAKVS